MITEVCKRDGSVAAFDENKIYSAISYAYLDVYKEIDSEKEDEISEIIYKDLRNQTITSDERSKMEEALKQTTAKKSNNIDI